MLPKSVVLVLFKLLVLLLARCSSAFSFKLTNSARSGTDEHDWAEQ